MSVMSSPLLLPLPLSSTCSSNMGRQRSVLLLLFLLSAIVLLVIIISPRRLADDRQRSLDCVVSSSAAVRRIDSKDARRKGKVPSLEWSDVFSSSELLSAALLRLRKNNNNNNATSSPTSTTNSTTTTDDDIDASIWISPIHFYRALAPLTSAQLTDALREGELRGRDVLSWWDKNHLLPPLTTNELDERLSVLADRYGPDNVGADKNAMPRGFRGTDLYNSIEQLVCPILSEPGTHVHLLGDSTIQALLGKALRPLGCHNNKDNNLSVKTRLHTTPWHPPNYYYYHGAFNETLAAQDYSVPNGTKRTLVVANFDALHSLALYPNRHFQVLQSNGQLFYDAFDDYVKWQLEKIRKFPGVELITVGTNAVAEERYVDGYQNIIRDYRKDPSGYAERCSRAWNVSENTCRKGLLGDSGSKYATERIERLLLQRGSSVDIDAWYITKNMGYLSARGDGRHYPPLTMLKMVQIVVVYMLRRIRHAILLEGKKAIRSGRMSASATIRQEDDENTSSTSSCSSPTQH